MRAPNLSKSNHASALKPSFVKYDIQMKINIMIKETMMTSLKTILQQQKRVITCQ
jgi:hypothetical protein